MQLAPRCKVDHQLQSLYHLLRLPPPPPLRASRSPSRVIDWRKRDVDAERIRSAESERRLWPVIHSGWSRKNLPLYLPHVSLARTCTLCPRTYTSVRVYPTTQEARDGRTDEEVGRKKVEIDRCVADLVVRSLGFPRAFRPATNRPTRTAMSRIWLLSLSLCEF